MSDTWKVFPYDFAVMRTPLMAENFIRAGDTAFMTTSDISAGRVSASLENIRKLIQSEVVSAAIQHASSSLASRAGELSTSDLEKKNVKLAVALYKYLSRMCMRCTPFGIMATVSTIDIRERTDIQVDERIRIHARLDNEHAWRIARELDSHQIMHGAGDYYVLKNNTMHVLASEVRRVVQNHSNDFAHYSYASVRKTLEISSVLDMVEKKIRVIDLVDHLCDGLTCERADAQKFVDDLVRYEILTTDLGLELTSGDCFRALKKRVTNDPVLNQFHDDIEGIDENLRKLQSTYDMAEGSAIGDIVRRIKKITGKEKINNPVHIDTYRDLPEASLGRDDVQALVDDFASILPLMWGNEDSNLKEFAGNFQKRYGDAEVPLLEALDPDTGIVFGPPRSIGQPLLAGIARTGGASDINLRWNTFHDLMLAKVLDAREQDSRCVVLDKDELARIHKNTGAIGRPIDATTALHASLLVAGIGQEAPLWLFRSAYGASAAAMLGRFTCGDDRLAKKIQDLCQDEQENSDKVLAEIVHFQAGKTANVSARKTLRKHEIVYGPVSASPDAEVIQCEDLMLRVKSGEIRLRSTKLNKLIAPRLASAHNTLGLNLPVYQFLAALQYVGGRPGAFPISPVLQRMKYMPRIQVGSLIIALATWRLSTKDISEVTSITDPLKILEAAQILRKRLDLPQHISVSLGSDNILEIDFEDAVSVLAFAYEIKGASQAILNESIRDLGRSCVQSKAGKHHNEIIIPVRIQRNHSHLGFVTAPDLGEPMRQDLPMGDWVYFDIYTGESTAERILIEVIAPLGRILRDRGLIKRWFFIRYHDSDGPHLRVRFCPTSKESRIGISDAVSDAMRPWVNESIVHKLRISGYVYEVERYGGMQSLAICEDIFHLHSSLIVHALGVMAQSANKENYRWIFAFYLVWKFLNEALVDINEIVNFSTRMAESYGREMLFDKTASKAISKNYREHLADIENCLDSKHSWIQDEVLLDDQLVGARRDLLDKLRVKHAGISFNNIISSLIHMDCNRVFPFSARANEMVIYEYVKRYATSLHVRS